MLRPVAWASTWPLLQEGLPRALAQVMGTSARPSSPTSAPGTAAGRLVGGSPAWGSREQLGYLWAWRSS